MVLATETKVSKKTPARDIYAYATGECANSLVTNGVGAFALLYYTQALGVDARLTGAALALPLMWDAVIDPFMGQISDNTHSRYGRRHPYILFGGILMVLCFYFFWAVPQAFRSTHVLFWYLVVINVLLRTATTIFFVPYIALGFEICTDYVQRAKLQGTRMGFNMAFNLLGPALAWTIFFKDRAGVESTNVVSNFINMGTVFSVAMLLFVLMIVFTTKKYIEDTRESLRTTSNNLWRICKDIKDALLDKYPRTVFIFILMVAIGFVLVSSLQLYVYVYFMKFSSVQKTFVHGFTMIGCGAGALVSSLLVKKLDKKPAVCVGTMLSVVCNLLLAAFFLTGLIPTNLVYELSGRIPFLAGGGIPVSMICFMIFHTLYWAGFGILLAVSTSMMADVSEISMHMTGINKDGTYAGMFSFIIKASTSFGILISGFCLNWIGFISGGGKQSPEAIYRLAVVTFIGGAAISAISIAAILKYPINREYMEKIKSEPSPNVLTED